MDGSRGVLLLLVPKSVGMKSDVRVTMLNCGAR